VKTGRAEGQRLALAPAHLTSAALYRAGPKVAEGVGLDLMELDETAF
jgi:hypothetical protein